MLKVFPVLSPKNYKKRLQILFSTTLFLRAHVIVLFEKKKLCNSLISHLEINNEQNCIPECVDILKAKSCATIFFTAKAINIKLSRFPI